MFLRHLLHREGDGTQDSYNKLNFIKIIGSDVPSELESVEPEAYWTKLF